MPSDICVFVRFKDPCVFAGEEIDCTITFRNVADLQESSQSLHSQRHRSRQGSIGQLAANSRSSGKIRALQNPRLLAAGGPNGGANPGSRHKATMSLSIPSEFNPSVHSSRSTSPGKASRPIHKPQHSVSILTASTTPSDGISRDEYPHRSSTRPPIMHARSSTLQTPLSIAETVADRRSRASPQRRAFVPDQAQMLPPISKSTGILTTDRNGRRSPLSSLASPTSSAAESRQSTPDFKFPLESNPGISEPHGYSQGNQGPITALSNTQRLGSENPVAESVRSSAEVYSLSNHSQETLVSEQAALVSERPQFTQVRTRQPHGRDSASIRTPVIANLLMGYAQIVATFTLDGSLVDQSPFEEVKRKGFLGGQAGGGVVGMKKSQSKGGLLGSFNLNSIGESLGTFMGGSDLSSVKEMKALANSRAIPLLSTPQSLLFVDLQLAPGEEKAYRFAYKLPRGLPSSHRGKAIKITYNLTIGVQGAPGERDVQSVRQVNVPLRIFSGVNQDGEIFGHDLMQPHIVLRDMARTAPTEVDSSARIPASMSLDSVKSATQDFISYVDTLLDKNRRRQSSTGTLDATFGTSTANDTHQARQSINRAILFSNQISTGESSPNRFEIARNGLRVAVVVLDRPLHRLGETVTAIVDFSDGQTMCSSIRATLETTEKINTSLAIRSAASINRVTRRVYATHSENALFAKRIVFSPSIPDSATPTFLTSGVNLDWSLRFEFGTSRINSETDEPLNFAPDLLEEIVRDERGTIMAAVENIDCETFEVIIPFTVYGDIVSDGKDDSEVVGLPI